eukprot:1159134-Pelagomonas_calceolata.AAC.5
MGHTTHHGLNASIDLSKDLVHKDLSKGAVEGICSLSRADASDDDAADSSESGDDWGVSSEDADERGFPKAVQGGGLTSMQCTMALAAMSDRDSGVNMLAIYNMRGNGFL